MEACPNIFGGRLAITEKGAGIGQAGPLCLLTRGTPATFLERWARWTGRKRQMQRQKCTLFGVMVEVYPSVSLFRLPPSPPFPPPEGRYA